jgi:hypothetical protein
MITPIFEGITPENFGNTPADIADMYADEHCYHAALVARTGITTDEFMEFASRFVTQVGQNYGDSTVELRLDRVLPDSGDASELDKTEQGTVVPTPIKPEAFRELSAGAFAKQVVIKPVEDLPGMEYTFAMTYWSLRSPRVMKFYAQAVRSAEGRAFIGDLYSRMFYIPDSAPRKDLEVHLGIIAFSDAIRSEDNRVTMGTVQSSLRSRLWHKLSSAN